MARSVYSEITPEMEALANLCMKNGKIDPELYAKYDVKRGLRDINGNGVLTGLTDISEIRSSRMENGVKIPCEGQLFYRGYSIEDLVRSMPSDHSFGFEVTAYLLLFGELPNKEQLDGFIKQLSFYRTLPTNFVRDIIMKAPSGDMMKRPPQSVPVSIATFVPALTRPLPATSSSSRRSCGRTLYLSGPKKVDCAPMRKSSAMSHQSWT